MSHWQDTADDVCRETLHALPATATEAECRAALSAAYPFGQRAMSLYKTWLNAVRRHLEARFPDLRQKNARGRERRSETALNARGVLTRRQAQVVAGQGEMEL